jgi:hypothetical protein
VGDLAVRVAVYSIALNEQANVAGWAASAADADGIFLLDTGSTDDTLYVARSLGVSARVARFKDWRFDVARNASLELVPEDFDMCIALDLDERLQPGWRDALEQAFAAGATRPRYRYVWSWERPGVPGLVYGGDKIHARNGYVWRHPVHEVLTCVTTDGERQVWCDVEIHHHPDAGKSRGHYLPLLELAVAEDPDDDRNAHYYARELFFAGRVSEAEAEFLRHLALPSAVWGPERAQSCRYLYKITGSAAWLARAVEEAPGRREALVDAAWDAYQKQEWVTCLDSALLALMVKDRPLEYLTEEFAWGSLPHDLAAIASFRLGYFHEAKYHGMQALCLSPYDQRLVDNLTAYRKAAA